MSFDIFNYDESLLAAAFSNETLGSFEQLEALQRSVGKGALPDYLIALIRGLAPNAERSLAIHSASSIAGRKDPSTDRDYIRRSRGFMGSTELEKARYPFAIHHIKIFYNGASRARVFYKYDNDGKIKFLKNFRSKTV
jgi:hypothetical protein